MTGISLTTTVTLSHSATGGGYGSAALPNVTVRVKDSGSEVNVSTQRMAIHEGDDAGGTYSVVLTRAPTGTVTITIGGNSGTDVTVNPASLTFTTSTWNTAQTVTVSAANDTDVADDWVTLSHSVSGGGYGTTAIPSVTVHVQDRGPEVRVSTGRMAILEGDQPGGTYSVVLAREPTGTVTVTIGGTSGTDVTVNPASLTFTTSTWHTRQTVSVSAAEDNDSDADTASITHTASGGGIGSVPISSVTVEVRDDDRRVVATPRQMTLDEGATASYELRAKGWPETTVTVSVDVPSGSDVTVNPSTVTFTPSNWDQPRTIQVSAAHDADWGSETVTVEHPVSGAEADTFAVNSVKVTVDDDDRVRAWIDDGGGVNVTEGGRGSYKIWLQRAPSAPVTVTITGTSKVSVSPTSLSFDSTNWSDERTVTVEAEQDADTIDDLLHVTHTAGDGSNSTQLGRVRVFVADDDDAEDLIGTRPADALWWAALTARSETGGTVGYIDYTSPHQDTGGLSDSDFTYGGVVREIDGLFVNGSGRLKLWVDTGDSSALPNSLVLHVGSRSMTLGSATRHSFYDTHSMMTVRVHVYDWSSGSHSVSLSDRDVVAVWLEAPAGSELPGTPESVQAQARDGGARLEWTGPPEVPSKPVQHYEYQQDGETGWTPTGGPETTKEVTGLTNGESYKFRVRAVNAEGKGSASEPSAPVTPEAPGLTAEFTSVPASHDGSSRFTFCASCSARR